MPSFSGIEVTVQADIDFEVFCGTFPVDNSQAVRYCGVRK